MRNTDDSVRLFTKFLIESTMHFKENAKQMFVGFFFNLFVEYVYILHRNIDPVSLGEISPKVNMVNKQVLYNRFIPSF